MDAKQERLDDYELIDVPQWSQDQLDKMVREARASLAKELQIEFQAKTDQIKATHERVLNSKVIDLKSQHEVKIHEINRIHDKDVATLKAQVATLVKEQEGLKKQLAASKEAYKRIENRLANEFIKN
ncbi:hypothetical protein GQ607_015604 [Colletotrichum asianum]|uniref:Uncharacterized protein n=1 Tax=Colletotrichum asianum TaxID=702518 RepID=A0A8H3VYB1_9PEZI|nr:hypothetical protein GQ607_015604 [Colletotrichum asianum]